MKFSVCLNRHVFVMLGPCPWSLETDGLPGASAAELLCQLCLSSVHFETASLYLSVFPFGAGGLMWISLYQFPSSLIYFETFGCTRVRHSTSQGKRTTNTVLMYGWLVYAYFNSTKEESVR